MSPETIFFSCFILFVVVVLMFDLGLFKKDKDTKVSFKEATIWTSVWITCAILFYFFIKTYGHLIHGIDNMEKLKLITSQYNPTFQFKDSEFANALTLYRNQISIEFLTGYFIEYSLSADNLFVILLVFTSFSVPEKYYKRILLWGVLGAIIMRMLFIFVGATLIAHFHWILYIFGAFLVYSGLKMLFMKDTDEKMDTDNHPMVSFASKYFSVYPRFVKEHFIIKHKSHKKRFVTPLFVVLLVVEFSDLIFAVDSVPAIFAVTKDPYIVFFSNIFAIMGLRSLFFLLSNIMHLFHYLKYGLALLLVFIGFKMLFEKWLHELGMNNIISLMVIVAILGGSIGLSLLFPKKKPANV